MPRRGTGFAARSAASFPHTVWGRGKGGYSLSRKRISPLHPQEKGRGAFPFDPAHCRSEARRTARAAQCKCGAHGFAMNPYVSLRLATAPYYREARVTLERRQTACQMRHCFARRIVETGSRRKLGCTSTRWAERHPQGVCRIRKAAEPPTAAQQRMIEAEANRLATPNAATPRYGQCNRQALQLFKLQTRNVGGRGGLPSPFSWGSKGDILFGKRISPLTAHSHANGRHPPQRFALHPRAPTGRARNSPLRGK